MKSTTVMNVLTEEKHTFYNTQSLETNLITAIIYSTEDGQPKVYSQAFDMIAYESV